MTASYPPWRSCTKIDIFYISVRQVAFAATGHFLCQPRGLTAPLLGIFSLDCLPPQLFMFILRIDQSPIWQSLVVNFAAHAEIFVVVGFSSLRQCINGDAVYRNCCHVCVHYRLDVISTLQTTTVHNCVRADIIIHILWCSQNQRIDFRIRYASVLRTVVHCKCAFD